MNLINNLINSNFFIPKKQKFNYLIRIISFSKNIMGLSPIPINNIK